MLEMTRLVRVCVLTFRATLAKFLTEVLGSDAGARAVTRLARVVTRLIVVHMIGGAICMKKFGAFVIHLLSTKY